MSIRACSRALPIALFLLASGQAFAACTVQPFFLPIHFRVGADSAHCQYNDIQSAINAIGECPTVIDITREHLYTHQHLSIDNKANVTLQGWGDGVTCAQIPGAATFPPYNPPADIAPLVSLDGNNDGNARVLTITGTSNVQLRNLTVLRGNTNVDASGGGISVDGQGSLKITRSTVSFNGAGYGGGININGSSGAATLTLDTDTLIISNNASTSGGGIRLEGNARLFALQPKTLIAFNHATNGYGGGIEVLGPARVDVGSAGYNGLGVIYDNVAPYGGGIAALAISDGNDAMVRLFTTDPNNPVQVVDNTASSKGGGIYLKSHFQFIPFELSYAITCASDFRINDNIAPDGTAVYADRDQDLAGNYAGSDIELNQSDLCGPEPASALGAVACANGVACNEMAHNVAEQSDATPTDGATIILDNNGILVADKLIVRNNTGGRALRLIGETNPENVPHIGGSLSNCLFVDNNLSAELIRDEAYHSDAFAIDGCTFANNTIGTAAVMRSEDALNVTNTLIDQPGKLAVDYAAFFVPLQASYLLSTDLSTLPTDPTIRLLGDPQFIDAANGNYHLQPTSPAVDYSGGSGGFDLEGHARAVDLPGTPNTFGPRDLGPYEIQRVFACGSDDTLFCDGFDVQ